jgi:Putative DNA-binding domain
MNRAIPLGKRESVKLEFKGPDSRPIDIAREVVAFLNAEGGELWWGVKEADGKAAATEPFQDGEARKRDLQNHLIDTLEPSPTIPGEVDIDLVPEGDSSIIRIQVKPAPRGRSPVAQLKDHGRRYWLRVGDRVRMMSREEIRTKFTKGSEASQEIEQQLLADREEVRIKKKPCLWLKIVPDAEMDIRFGDEEKALLTDPAATGNRSSGWNFIRELGYPRPFARGLRLRDEFEEVEMFGTGTIVLSATLARLHWKGGENEIWPFALVEYPVSVMRLAAKLFEKWGSDISEILVDFAFVGLRGWTLRGGSPSAPSGRFRSPAVYEEDNDLNPPKPFRFTREEITTEPDRCGLRLITFIYRAFGYEESAIPPEFDRKTGVLVIPK